ncbi:histidine-tRNA ligase [Mycena olivaceomarginata]|nr:histidine-tRNA ligase [Mycena olivaceomarginata]
MASIESISEQISNQTALFNQLRLQNAEASLIDEAKKKLGELKKSLALSKGSDASAPKDGGKKRSQGTRDYGPAEMFCRETIERTVKECFTTYGGSCLDTPVFERKDILTGKYGEDAKLIFDLMDQGGEQLALRYDHTVPLARVPCYDRRYEPPVQNMASRQGLSSRYPVISKGRMREFSQADFDICGTWDPMIPDGEIISLVCTILTKLDVGEFTIKVYGIFEVCGVPADKIRPISSAVDKLDKLPWAEVKKEMTAEKGLDEAAADKIGEYVNTKLTADETLMANANAKQGISDMGLLFTYLRAYGVLDKLSFDLSLARGLDYYTGIITRPSSRQKAAKKQPKADGEEEEEIDESQVGVGSIAAGGRYDGLVGMFTAAAAADGKKAAGLPCIGISIGLDRIFALVWPKWVEKGGRCKETMVYVMAAGDGLLEERIKLVRELRESGIKADFLAKKKPKLNAQFAAGEQDEVPFAVILGADELKSGNVRVKEQKWEVIGEGDTGALVQRDGLVEWIKGTPTYREINAQ